MHCLRRAGKSITTSVVMEVDVLLWYNWASNSQPIELWKDLKDQALERVGKVQDGVLQEQVFNLNQRGTLVELWKEFKHVSALT